MVRGGLSFHEELNYYIRNLDNYEYKPGHLFKELILSVLENYGIKELKPSIEGEMNIKPVAFFNIQVSYYICYENKDVIKKLIRILSYSSNTLPSTAETLVSLMNYEQSEPDDSLAVFARKVLSEKFPEVIKRMAGEIESLSENSAVDFIQRAFPPESMAVMAEFESSLKASASAEKGNSVKVENRELAAKLEVLAQKYRLAPLYSPFDDIILYSEPPTARDQSPILWLSLQ